MEATQNKCINHPDREAEFSSIQKDGNYKGPNVFCGPCAVGELDVISNEILYQDVNRA